MMPSVEELRNVPETQALFQWGRACSHVGDVFRAQLETRLFKVCFVDGTKGQVIFPFDHHRRSEAFPYEPGQWMELIRRMPGSICRRCCPERFKDAK